MYCTNDSLFSFHNTEVGWQREVTLEESCVEQAGLQEGAGSVALIRQCYHFPKVVAYGCDCYQIPAGCWLPSILSSGKGNCGYE